MYIYLVRIADKIIDFNINGKEKNNGRVKIVGI